MRKSETHHHNKVEHKEKGEAAGVAQEACESRNWSKTSDQWIKMLISTSFLPILGNIARGRTTQIAMMMSSNLPSSYQAFLKNKWT